MYIEIISFLSYYYFCGHVQASNTDMTTLPREVTCLKVFPKLVLRLQSLDFLAHACLIRYTSDNKVLARVTLQPSMGSNSRVQAPLALVLSYLPWFCITS